VSDWLKAYAAESKALDITDAWQTVGEPMEVDLDGPHAYVVLPAVYGVKQHGNAVQVNATVTVVLGKSSQDWSFLAWNWAPNGK
jgi:hypothetical protein